MKFDILTLFPEMFEAVKQSVIGKAIEKQLIQINLINIRDFFELGMEEYYGRIVSRTG